MFLGKIGITIDSIWAEPKTNSSVDIAAAEREMQMGVSMFLMDMSIVN